MSSSYTDVLVRDWSSMPISPPEELVSFDRMPLDEVPSMAATASGESISFGMNIIAVVPPNATNTAKLCANKHVCRL